MSDVGFCTLSAFIHFLLFTKSTCMSTNTIHLKTRRQKTSIWLCENPCKIQDPKSCIYIACMHATHENTLLLPDLNSFAWRFPLRKKIFCEKLKSSALEKECLHAKNNAESFFFVHTKICLKSTTWGRKLEEAWLLLPSSVFLEYESLPSCVVHFPHVP